MSVIACGRVVNRRRHYTSNRQSGIKTRIVTGAKEYASIQTIWDRTTDGTSKWIKCVAISHSNREVDATLVTERGATWGCRVAEVRECQIDLAVKNIEAVDDESRGLGFDPKPFTTTVLTRVPVA